MKSKPIIVAASVLACDFARLGEECLRIEKAGSDWLHLDVMDGHFVDNISFGPMVVERIAKVARVPLDVHLMIEHPEHFFPRFLPYAASITIHVEALCRVGETLKEIRQKGARCGLALSPPTSFEKVEPFLGQIDLLLVMTVNPGFGGQAFIPEMMEKVKRAASIRNLNGLDFHIQVDGGIHTDTAAVARKAGVNVFVAGTGIFRSVDPSVAIQALRDLKSD